MKSEGACLNSRECFENSTIEDHDFICCRNIVESTSNKQLYEQNLMSVKYYENEILKEKKMKFIDDVLNIQIDFPQKPPALTKKKTLQ